MEVLFLKLLNMSITASWLVLVVALLRLVLKKAPKAIFCFLWALVALRLLCPFSFESVLSLIPSAETIPKEIVTSEAPAINSGFYALNSAVNPVISKALAPDAVQGANPVQRISAVASAVWIAGVILMVLYALISYIRLHRKTREGIELVRGVWLCDHIDSSFILGVIHPRIFLPSSITETDRKYVIAHEKAHLKRLDYIWKPLGFTLLTVY